MPLHLRRSLKPSILGALASLLIACGGSTAPSDTPADQGMAPAPEGASAPPTAAEPAAAQASEPVFEAEMIGPLTKEVPLQIVSVFSYEAGEQLISPATEVAAFVAEARTKQGYGKEPLKTLLVEPTPASIKASRLLVIAWGPRAEFSLERVKEVGRAAMRETLKAGVVEMAYAPIARDQGVTTLPAEDVAKAFVEGALSEFLAAQRADRADPKKPLALKHVTYEAGPAFIDAVKKAIPLGVAAAHGK
ncbi:hypothetical protein [Chondromyces apiculatus]|uniref:Peptidase M17 leucyl aminopeptidase N-terminal domain-containing protein n=1 Tax=Chondromyces apiculatus DSM 436 TaxID=1192034 RepID=A0A017T6X2_9BACT|nr:hypothetical protein [Chondromyces apiculatus]EYF05003.1 Hypothetical protein CAP_3593 [Chondromyces apiculatus DSM 436]